MTASEKDVQALFEANIPRAEQCARQFFRRGKGISFEELRTVALTGLWQAAQRHLEYQGRDGGSWNSYSWLRMCGQITDEARRQSWKSRRGSQQMAYFGLSSHEELTAAGLSEPSVEATETDPVGHENLRRSLTQLPEKLRRIVTAVHFEQRSQDEVAQELGVTRARVSQLLTVALARLRKGVALPDHAVEVSGESTIPKSTPKLTEAFVREVLELTNSGLSQKEITKRLGTSEPKVRYAKQSPEWEHLRPSTLKIRTRQNFTNQEAAQILRLRRDGWTYERIGELLHRNSTSIWRVVNHKEWEHLRIRSEKKREKRRLKLTQKEIVRLNFLARQNWSTAEIAKDLRCTASTVCNYRFDKGQRIRKPLTRNERVRVQEDYRKGVPVTEIAKTHRVCVSLVYLHVKSLPRRYRPTSAEDKHRIYSSFDSGLTVAQISRTLGIEYNVVRKYIHRWKNIVPKPRQRLTDEQRRRFVELIDAGRKDREIATELGLSLGTVSSRRSFLKSGARRLAA